MVIGKVSDKPKYIEIVTMAGVACGVFWGMKNRLSFGKTAFYAIALGVAGNYIANVYYKFETNEEG